MYAINEDLKTGKYKSVYLLCGPEGYLVRRYRDKLLNAFCGSSSKKALSDDMNFNAFIGKEVTVGQVIDLAETLPFFAERRVILIEDSGLFMKDGDKLAEYLADKPETTVFIFVESAADKRSKLYKAVTNAGHAAEFRVQDEDTLKRWIVSIVRKENKQITVRAVEALLERTASDMELLSKELEKLFCYTQEKDSIDLPDVEAICTTVIGNHIFDMISAMANKNQMEALRLYYELLALREPPMKILSLIGRQFAQMIMIKDLRNRGYDKRKISEKTEIKPFIVDKYLGQAAKFSTATLKAAMEDCVNFDDAVKKGNLSDRMCVELLLVKYSGKSE